MKAPTHSPFDTYPGRERGLVLDGRVLAGTEERVIRAPALAWFEPGSRGTRRRAAEINAIVSHWTAGAEHEDEAGLEGDKVDDAGIRVFRNMRARKRKDGSPMEVGCDIVIAACDPDAEWAEIWQLADPIRTATVHVSTDWNPRSIGIERCMPGTEKQARRLGSSRPIVERVVVGQRRRVADFYPGEVRSFVWLCDQLARAFPSIPRVVPTDARGRLLRGRMTRAQGRRWKGALEHYLSPSTKKIDTGTHALEQLLQAGWEGRPV